MSTNTLWSYYSDGHYQVLGRSACKKVATMDHYLIDDGEVDDGYVESYYVAINIWLNLIREYDAEPLFAFVKHEITTRGLARTISECKSAATAIIDAYGVAKTVNYDDLLTHCIPALCGFYDNWKFYDVHKGRSGLQEKERTLLMLLRFLSRFQPSRSSILGKQSLKEFFLINNCETIYHSWAVSDSQSDPRKRGDYCLDRHALSYLQEACENILSETFPYEEDFYLPAFATDVSAPGGAPSDVCDCEYCKSIAGSMWFHDKILAHPMNQRMVKESCFYVEPIKKEYVISYGRFDTLAQSYGCLGSMLSDLSYTVDYYGRPYIPHFFHKSSDADYRYAVKPIAVGKSATAARIIAPHPIRAYYNGSMIKEWLIDCVEAEYHKWVDYPVDEKYWPQICYVYYSDDDDQKRWRVLYNDSNDGKGFLYSRGRAHGLIVTQHAGLNRELAKLGSKDRSYDTIDMSNASDRQRSMIWSYVIPDWFRKSFYTYPTADFFVNDHGQTILSRMIAPSGDPRTFMAECIFHATGLEAAYIMYERFFMRGNQKPLLPYAVHGDDCVVDSRVTELALEFLSVLGLKPNLSKTFCGSTPYRESCGGEYLKGVDICPIYWPRNLKFTGKDAGWLPSIGELNNRIYRWLRPVPGNESPTLGFLRQYIRERGDRRVTFIPDEYADEGSLLGEQAIYEYLCYIPGHKWLTIKHGTLFDVANDHGDLTQSYVTTRRTSRVPVSKKPLCPCKGIRSAVEKRAIFDEMTYTRYACEGPLYIEPIDELLNVSTRRPSYDDVTQGACFVIKQKR